MFFPLAKNWRFFKNKSLTKIYKLLFSWVHVSYAIGFSPYNVDEPLLLINELHWVKMVFIAYCKFDYIIFLMTFLSLNLNLCNPLKLKIVKATINDGQLIHQYPFIILIFISLALEAIFPFVNVEHSLIDRYRYIF